MPIYSIDHMRSWKHDVRGSDQKMGGHHFMSPFTLSLLHIELPVASPLSLTRVPSHFLSSPHLPITPGWGLYSACMLWLDTSWVLDLTYIFMSHPSLFSVIFSTLTSSHHFFQHHISPLVIFVLCLFFHHCLLDIILVSPWVVVFHTLLHGG